MRGLIHLPHWARRNEYLLRMRGEVWCELDGELVDHRKNLYVNVGYQRIAAWLASNVQNGGAAVLGPGYIAVGTSTTAPLAADTIMGVEAMRLPITSASVQTSYTARLVSVFNGQQVNANLREIGLFDTAGVSGTSTGANTTTTLNDTTQNWAVNQWAGATVFIWSGVGAGQRSVVVSNTATQLTVSVVWTTTPDATSKYAIGAGNLFGHAAITVNKAAGQILNVIWQLTAPSN